MSEENLRASMNLREKQERLDSVFDFMREPCWAWGACPTYRSMCTPVAPSRPESDQRSPDEAQEHGLPRGWMVEHGVTFRWSKRVGKRSENSGSPSFTPNLLPAKLVGSFSPIFRRHIHFGFLTSMRVPTSAKLARSSGKPSAAMFRALPMHDALVGQEVEILCEGSNKTHSERLTGRTKWQLDTPHCTRSRTKRRPPLPAGSVAFTCWWVPSSLRTCSVTLLPLQLEASKVSLHCT
jgi:hypothetical protein